MGPMSFAGVCINEAFRNSASLDVLDLPGSVVLGWLLRSDSASLRQGLAEALVEEMSYQVCFEIQYCHIVYLYYISYLISFHMHRYQSKRGLFSWLQSTMHVSHPLFWINNNEKKSKTVNQPVYLFDRSWTSFVCCAIYIYISFCTTF